MSNQRKLDFTDKRLRKALLVGFVLELVGFASFYVPSIPNGVVPFLSGFLGLAGVLILMKLQTVKHKRENSSRASKNKEANYLRKLQAAVNNLGGSSCLRPLVYIGMRHARYPYFWFDSAKRTATPQHYRAHKNGELYAQRPIDLWHILFALVWPVIHIVAIAGTFRKRKPSWFLIFVTAFSLGVSMLFLEAFPWAGYTSWVIGLLASMTVSFWNVGIRYGFGFRKGKPGPFTAVLHSLLFGSVVLSLF